MRYLTSLFALVVFVIPVMADEKPTPVKVEPSWKGSVADETLQKQAPVITNQKTFTELMKAWKVEAKVEEIDFTKNIVLVVTSRGSVLNLVANLKDGNLQSSGFGTKDLRPGFRYVVGVVSREGVKTVNGKELAKE